MAGARKNRGFTLVELLVVITIIGMLVALLLPAIQSAREAGRRNTCQNNMRNCVLAMMNYESNRKSFPGYSNMVNNKRASWVVPLLPFLERNDLFGIWQNQAAVSQSSYTSITGNGTQLSDGTNTVQNPWAYSELNILECPSNPNVDTSRNPNSFVVNCGSAKTSSDNIPSASTVTNNWPEDANSGVCFNQFGGDQNNGVGYLPGMTPSGTGPKVSIDFISTSDGTSYTLLMSENLQSSTWATDATQDGATQVLNPWQSDFQIKQNMGFVWFITGNTNNAGPPPTPSMGINSQGTTGPSPLKPVAYDAMDPSNKPGMSYSRPSSSHPTGVITAFCDGHVRFLSEEIQYHVYTQLMTPRNNKVVIQRDTTSPYAPQKTIADLKWPYIISETDYE